MRSQGLISSEPSIAETGVWCELSDGIDPAEWTRICRHIGSLSSCEFERISKILISKLKMQKTDVFEGYRRLLQFKVKNSSDLPIVGIVPSKSGDVFQREI